MTEAKLINLATMAETVAPPYHVTADAYTMAIRAKVLAFRAAGRVVTVDPVIPGLWRVDGGPELTSNQFLSLPV